MPTKDVRGREIIVKLRGGKIVDDRPPDDRTGRGMIPPRRPDPRPVRRRRRPEGGIKIYDTNLRTNGAVYSDRPFRSPMIATPTGVSSFVAINSPGLAEYEALTDDLFTVPVASWAENYKKLTTDLMRSAAYRVFVGGFGSSIVSSDAAEDAFEGDQILLPAEVLAEPIIFAAVTQGLLNAEPSAGFFDDVYILKGAGALKFTATRDYDADAVVYSPANGDEWFLIPILTYPNAGFNASPPVRNEAYFGAWRAVPRQPAIEPGPNYMQPVRASWASSGGTTGDGYPGVHRILNTMQSDPAAGATAWRFVNSGGTSYITTSIDPAAMPNPAYWPDAGSPLTGATQAFATWNAAPVGLPTGGRLVIVIKKAAGGGFIYGWK